MVSIFLIHQKEIQHIGSANMSKSTFMMLYMIFCLCLVDKTTVNLKNFWRLYRHLSTLLIYNFLIWNFINSPVFLINIIFLKLLNMSSKKNVTYYPHPQQRAGFISDFAIQHFYGHYLSNLVFNVINYRILKFFYINLKN